MNPHDVGIIIGPPGSGKGVIARTAPKAHFRLLSSSQILRTRGDDRIKKLMLTSPFVPEELCNPLFRQELEETAPQDLILDAVPRSITQYQFIKKVLKDLGYQQRNIFTIHVKVPLSQAERRLRNRHRSDDTPIQIANRLDHYQKVTVPLIRVLSTETRLICFDNSADASEEEQDARAWKLFGEVNREHRCDDPGCLRIAHAS